MNKKSKTLFLIFIGLLTLSVGELLYIDEHKSMSEEALANKKNFVRVTGLPDLAFASEDAYIRHRTLSSIFSIYSVDGSLREDSKVSFSTTSLQNKGRYE
jgi:hypothetical protein